MADIIMQKLPVNNKGYKILNAPEQRYGKYDERMYTRLSSLLLIDRCRYQAMYCDAGRTGHLNSGGESGGVNDLKHAVTTAIINKRVGGMGLITGRKAFHPPFVDGINLLHAVQDLDLERISAWRDLNTLS
jgi:class I fructose-bisphosphate aldolase